ncbi:excisionase family DNA binding protein [Terracoccus luteus]|uniref:Excisionase family DNA binding protein n=1 Tax=Terracoccus luteus TaxID=53356 RepID=A0A495XX82_9MICO|nr:helix-turn-helix domain-containing protein [Terracoccus luteus]RKT79210.1 excisionase family DNA binding protein [Terracoccus luteus]
MKNHNTAMASTIEESSDWNREGAVLQDDSSAPWHNPNPLWEVEQFARYLNQKPEFIRQLIKQQRIASVKIGRKVMLEKSEADQRIANGRRPAARPLNPDRFGY